MSNNFKREARYVVLKNADIMQCLTINELIELRRIQAKAVAHRAKLGKPWLDCVVVESDWPEYEPTWRAIEARASNPAAISGQIDRLEAAEKERDWHAGRCEDTMNECDALHAHIEAMEQQEPVGCVESLFDDFVIIHHSFDRAAPVYLAPGAQPAPSVPTDVITDYLVSISAHLAHQDDRKAQAEIGELLKMLAAAPEAKP